MPEIHEPIFVDYLFVGGGASARLLMMSLDRHHLLNGKKVVVIDPEVKSRNDKTFCFWASPNELSQMQCESLVGHRWNKVSVDGKQPESLEEMEYLHISSLALYQSSDQIMKNHKVELHKERALQIIAHKKGIKITTSTKQFFAQYVFDSRPPVYLPPQNNETHLLQSFIGYIICPKKSIGREDTIHLMDFGVDQLENTQFVYILPFSKDKILVELTRFGVDTIPPDEAEPILNRYILSRFGPYEIQEIEMGCIPMCSSPLENSLSIEGLIPIGGRAGAIKPSTGYAFKNMAYHAERIATALEENRKPENSYPAKRFKLYDRLLLFILTHYPYLGKIIFQTLFKKNKTQIIFHFLDEKTNFIQEAAIFLSLPIRPFLKALWIDCSIRFQKSFAPTLLLLFSVGLLIMQSILPIGFEWTQFILLAIGLFTIGIPHGALDHLLDHSEKNTKAAFVLHYLAAFIVFLLVWLWMPFLAITLFIVYSAWHFGQTDMQEWQIRNAKPLKAFLWGITILAIILFGHTSETNVVLHNMSLSPIPWNKNDGQRVAYCIGVIGLVWSWYERRNQMSLITLVLIISISLPLLTSFGLFFIGHHSLNGWRHLRQGLHTNHQQLFAKALPFTLGALGLMIIMLILFRNGRLLQFQGEWMTIFFVFISCLSFPHVIAMHRFYLKINSGQLISPIRKNKIKINYENKT